MCETYSLILHTIVFWLVSVFHDSYLTKHRFVILTSVSEAIQSLNPEPDSFKWKFNQDYISNCWVGYLDHLYSCGICKKWFIIVLMGLNCGKVSSKEPLFFYLHFLPTSFIRSPCLNSIKTD